MRRQTVLLAAASPIDRPANYGMLELRACKTVLAEARGMRVVVCESASIDGLRRALLMHSPVLVHLAAHADDGCVFLEDEEGYADAIAHEHLAAVLLAHHPPLEHVVATVCRSLALVERLADGGVTACGLRGRETAAGSVEFSRGLHEAVAAKRTFEFAVGEGLRRAALRGHRLNVEYRAPRPT